MPYPIAAVHLPAVTRQNIICGPEESLVLTGDENIVDMKSLFNTQPWSTVKEVAESAMRDVSVGPKIQPHKRQRRLCNS